MKTSILLFTFLFTVSAGIINSAKAQGVLTKDSMALVDLYNSTNGSSWKNHTNWLIGPVNTWYGVTVLGNRVINIFLEYNKMSGTIPASIGDLDSLREINFGSSNIHGKIPATIGNLSALVSLIFAGNHLTGNLPSTIFKLKKIALFDVSYNYLTAYNNDSFYLPNTRSFDFDLIVNRFTFNEIESIARSFPNAYYNPQQRITIHQHDNALAVSAGGTLSNNTYKWFKVGTAGATTIVGDSVFTPSSSGTYYVRVTNAVATKLTLTADSFVYIMPEAKSVSAQNQIHIYPNPVKDILKISGLNANLNSSIAVADVSGTIWMNTASQKQSTVNINVSKLQLGNYVLIITDDKNIRKLSFVKE
jgi:hypothetical protein